MKDKFRGLKFVSRRTHCPVCKAIDLRQIYGAEDLRLDRCGDCGVVFVNPQPDVDSIATLYAGDYFEGIYEPQEKACIAYFTDAISLIDGAASPGRLLEVGPGPGYFLRVSSSRGWDVTGVELSSYAAARLRERWGFRVLEGTVASLPLDISAFNMVVMWDVLEHMTDPLAALTDVRSRLAPGGRLVLKVPNLAGLRPRLNRTLTQPRLIAPVGRALGIENYYADHGFHHLYYFTRRSVRRLLQVAGFTIRAVSSVPEPTFARTERRWKSIARSIIDGVSAAVGQREALLVQATVAAGREAEKLPK